MRRQAEDRIAIALLHLSTLRQHLERGPLEDPLVFDAVCQRLGASIEEVTALPEDLVVEAFGVRWRGIRATRNALAHNYQFVDQAAIRETIADNLDDYEAGLRRILTILAAD